MNEGAIKNRMYRCLGKIKNDLESWHIAAPFNPKQYIILVNKLEKEQPGNDMQKVTDDFTAVLRKHFERITSALNFMPLRKITYEIYPDRESLLAKSQKQGDESHTVTATFGESDLIRIVSPLNPGPFDYHYIIQGSLFMYTATLSKQMNPRIPGWALFGVGGYVGSAWPRERVQKGLSFYYRNRDIPSLKDFGNLGNKKMVKRNFLCYTMVDFVVTRYSWDALHRFIRDPGNGRSIFQCDFSQWEEAWKQFVKEQYIC
jgi:RNA polymerase sigma-70 factor (ECF subfamily)